MAYEADVMEISEPVGASVWEADLFRHLVTHTRREGLLLKEYADAADATESKAFAYLVRLLCQDEYRHHQYFLALAEALKTDAELDGTEPVIPYMDFNRADTEKIRNLTRRLLRSEQEDAENLEQLHVRLRDVKDTTLWDVLIDMMRRDTAKHEAMLKFVMRHT